jgi:hypothetical protein
LKRFFSFLLLIALFLLPWTQPAQADDQFPKKPVSTVAYIGYPPLDINSSKQTIFRVETNSGYAYFTTGPLFTEQGFRYSWICPDGASLIDNACYAKAASGESVEVVDPSAVQIAFAYNLDADNTTNEQLTYLASVSVPADDDNLLEDDLRNCKNPRRCLLSHCANGTTVYPPTSCPR